MNQFIALNSRNGQRTFLPRLRSRLRSNQEGSAVIEMAVTLPLVMLIMTGIFSFSMSLYQKLQLAEAVSNAGHMLAVDRGDHDPCATATNAIYNAAPGLSRTSLTIAITLNGNPETSSSCPGSGTTSPNTDLAEGSNALIQVSYPSSLSVYGRNFGGFDLVSQVTEVVQ